MEEPAGKYVTGPLEEFLFLKEMGKKQVLVRYWKRTFTEMPDAVLSALYLYSFTSSAELPS